VVPCLFATDLHGSVDRYETLFRVVEEEPPAAVFLGGDLLPSGFRSDATIDSGHRDFLNEYLAVRLIRARERLKDRYPRVFAILGNDDHRFQEAAVLEIAARGLWTYLHGRRDRLRGQAVYGYSFVPPSPFRLKDWERYDVSRYVDPGCVSPEEGMRSVPVGQAEIRYGTIRQDLERLTGRDDLADATFLFHTPPYQTALDRAALDGQLVDHVPLDVHVGSIAVRRFIEERQPRLTLHGHIHESARITGAWRDRIGKTHLLGAAHDGPELALVRFDLEDPAGATRELI